MPADCVEGLADADWELESRQGDGCEFGELLDGGAESTGTWEL